MRQLHLLVTSLVFLFALQGHATGNTKKKCAPKDQVCRDAKNKRIAKVRKATKLVVRTASTSPATKSMVRQESSNNVTVQLHHATVSTPSTTSPLVMAFRSAPPPIANTGGTPPCPFKNKATSPFSNEGKLTQVNRMLPGMATAYQVRAASGVN